ncbi:MAG: RsmD family RNA methyltransferase [bacterium]
MRIISGIFKSRILKSPESDRIRPTSDRAKETLFNILNNIIDFEGISCLDLFCGTGNLGLEAISRGAAMCYFVDRHTDLVKTNIEQLGVLEKSKVIKSDAVNYLNSCTGDKFDLIFCDPPYDFEYYDRLIEKISGFNTILVLEHSEILKLKPDFVKYISLKKKVGAVNFMLFDFGTDFENKPDE